MARADIVFGTIVSKCSHEKFMKAKYVEAQVLIAVDAKLNN